MIQLKDTIISLDLFERKFACDLKACKGMCCVLGDAGAPLEPDERQILDRIYPSVRPFMSEAGIRTAENEGLYTRDAEGEWVTTLIEGKECVFTVFDENNIARCALERAYHAGRTDFPKPVSCHLYPVRLKKYRDFTAVQYHEWEICEPARVAGERRNIRLYEFLREPLIRRFGREWYEELCTVARQWQKRRQK